ncbi:MAG: sporulation protein [Firmicutes bacterium HGW-Firmicutes-14]|nr:MAG: sporulation protein [Firmicutes bacterium HGW-Firmicutes-14]
MKMKWKKLSGIIVLVFLTAVIVSGCSLTGSKDKEEMGAGDRTPVEENGSESETPPVNPQPTTEKVELTLYFGDDQAMYLKPEKRTVEKGGMPVAELLVQELIKGPETDGLHKTIPDRTKLISLEITDGVAYVNFSKEAKTNHWGGSAGEAMTVQSVVCTLAQLPEIDQVQFLIDGEKEESIWGHGYTAEPISPAQDIIKGE